MKNQRTGEIGFYMNGIVYYSRELLVPLKSDGNNLIRLACPEAYTNPKRVQWSINRLREMQLMLPKIGPIMQKWVANSLEIWIQHRKNLRELGEWNLGGEMFKTKTREVASGKLPYGGRIRTLGNEEARV